MKRLLDKLDPWEKEMVAQGEVEDWVVRACVAIAFCLGVILGLSFKL